jgi:hypothetical protein
MGVDWVRMSPSPRVARGLLEELIEQQAAGDERGLLLDW